MESTLEPGPDSVVDQPEHGTERVRVLANGTLLDTVTGRFLPGSKPTTGIAPGDSRRARELSTRRHELAAREARRALAERAAADGLQRSPVAAYGVLAGMAYDSALANMLDKPREAVEAGKFTLRLAGMLPEVDRAAVSQTAVVINLAPDAAGFVDSVWREG